MRLMMLLSGFAALAFAAPVQSATTLQYVAANFSGGNSASGTPVVSYIDGSAPAGKEEVRWGTPVTPTGEQSGLRFASVPTITITPGTQFTLGTLTYFNNPIYAGSGIDKVSLGISTALAVDGAPLMAGPFTFGITIEETINDGPLSACPYPSNLACSDRISITTGATSQTFDLGGQTLTLYVDGFLDTALVPRSSFIAQEQESTTATLVGRFALASDVPEPATWAMMLVGFGAMGTAMRRRPKVPVTFKI